LPVSSNRDNLDFMGRRSTVAVVLLVATLAAAAVVHAQRYFREGSFAARWAPAQMPDGAFVICRLAYRSVRMEYSGIGWQTDYPYAEINLTTRLSELTRTRVSRDESQQPNFYVVRLTDDALFNCPITVASDAGTIGIRDDEAERLRTYLLRVGSCGPTTSGDRPRGITGSRRSRGCCRRRSTRSKMWR
jgi:hypothetical protein